MLCNFSTGLSIRWDGVQGICRPQKIVGNLVLFIAVLAILDYCYFSQGSSTNFYEISLPTMDLIVLFDFANHSKNATS